MTMPTPPKCANCDNEAVFEQADPVANAVLYCAKHLPGHLAKRADLGQLVGKTISEYRKAVAAALAAAGKDHKPSTTPTTPAKGGSPK